MLSHEEEVGGIEGIKVSRNAPSISHLLFADDSLIFMRATVQNASTLKRVLDTYCESSGQRVSTPKSSIFFSPNTRVNERENVCGMLNILTEALSDKYLGLPTIVGVDCSDCFQHLVDRVCQRLKGWKQNFLSVQGKKILLKAVARAIPSYAMSVFKLPKGICKSITDEISSFWWGDGEEKRKMHWFAWWKMCVPKKKGGMGFRDLHSFNLAMLAKQCWRLIQNPDSLCARVLSAKYYLDGNVLRTAQRKAPRLHGKVWLLGYKLSRGDVFGEWALAHRLTFGMIHGSHQVQQGRLSPLEVESCCQKCKRSLTLIRVSGMRH